MKQNIGYLGLDVDDILYLASAWDKGTGEVIYFKCRRGVLAYMVHRGLGSDEVGRLVRNAG